MASVSKFISICDSGDGTAGKPSITIKGRGKFSAVSIPVSLDLAGDESECDIATLLSDAINAAAVAAHCNYSGVPFFENKYADQTFQIKAISTEHLVNVWSQAQYAIEITDPGALTLYNGGAVLSTLSKADDAIGSYASLSKWSHMSHKQKASLLATASSELIALCKFDMIESQYMFEMRSNLTDGFHLSFYPIQTHDDIYAFYPSPVQAYENSLYAVSDFYEFLVERDGTVSFNSLGTLDQEGPLRKGNLIKMRYQAGLDYIPDAILAEMFKICKFVSVPSHIESIKTGTTAAKFKDDAKMHAGIVQRLQGLFDV